VWSVALAPIRQLLDWHSLRTMHRCVYAETERTMTIYHSVRQALNTENTWLVIMEWKSVSSNADYKHDMAVNWCREFALNFVIFFSTCLLWFSVLSRWLSVCKPKILNAYATKRHYCLIIKYFPARIIVIYNKIVKPCSRLSTACS